jgi:predicted NACHT family NTPase
VYAKLPHGRLVLLGEPGAGKTGAMILLLLAALDHRTSLPQEQRARIPVPVWLTLGEWDPDATPLKEWAAAVMNRDYPALGAPEYGPDIATELLRGGDVTLFLDGLDETPAGVRARALRRIEEEAAGIRVVLTSRPEEYRLAVEASHLSNAAVIELRPVRAASAADYLRATQGGADRGQWNGSPTKLSRTAMA